MKKEILICSHHIWMELNMFFYWYERKKNIDFFYSFQKYPIFVGCYSINLHAESTWKYARPFFSVRMFVNRMFCGWKRDGKLFWNCAHKLHQASGVSNNKRQHQFYECYRKKSYSNENEEIKMHKPILTTSSHKTATQLTTTFFQARFFLFLSVCRYTRAICLISNRNRFRHEIKNPIYFFEHKMFFFFHSYLLVYFFVCHRCRTFHTFFIWTVRPFNA